jgi:hypothetical protein
MLRFNTRWFFPWILLGMIFLCVAFVHISYWGYSMLRPAPPNFASEFSSASHWYTVEVESGQIVQPLLEIGFQSIVEIENAIKDRSIDCTCALGSWNLNCALFGSRKDEEYYAFNDCFYLDATNSKSETVQSSPLSKDESLRIAELLKSTILPTSRVICDQTRCLIRFGIISSEKGRVVVATVTGVENPDSGMVDNDRYLATLGVFSEEKDGLQKIAETRFAYDVAGLEPLEGPIVYIFTILIAFVSYGAVRLVMATHRSWWR